MRIVPKRIIECKPGPVIEGRQAVTTVVLELEDGSHLEVDLPTYLFTRRETV
jgi:hypothetical protein